MGVPEARAGEILDMIMEGARSLALVQKINEKEYISLDGAGGATSEEESYDPAEPIEKLEEENRESVATENLGPVLVSPTAVPVMDQANKRVFVTHGKNKEFIDPIKKMITYGKYEPVVAEEKQSVSKPARTKSWVRCVVAEQRLFMLTWKRSSRTKTARNTRFSIRMCLSRSVLRWLSMEDDSYCSFSREFSFLPTSKGCMRSGTLATSWMRTSRSSSSMRSRTFRTILFQTDISRTSECGKQAE
jgi:hypothetical protein